jgi:hypothetical protein
LGEDSVIKVWNLETFEKKTSNKDHVVSTFNFLFSSVIKWFRNIKNQ